MIGRAARVRAGSSVAARGARRAVIAGARRPPPAGHNRGCVPRDARAFEPHTRDDRLDSEQPVDAAGKENAWPAPGPSIVTDWIG